LSTSTPEISATAKDYTPNHPSDPLWLADYLVLILFGAVLFGYVAFSGRPLTLHEARLPETSREMLTRGDWLVPMDGDRPWLERPPFPHWCEMIVAIALEQHCDSEWSVRIPAALAGILVILMTAQIASLWFGRRTGLVSGLLLATMYEFYAYSTYAEDDIFLALLVVAAMALFVGMEFSIDPNSQDRRGSLFGSRPWNVAVFFVLLGLTNLAKGPLVGAAVIIGAIVTYFLMPSLMWRGENFLVVFRFPIELRRRMRRYFWFWGILAAVVIGLSWHLYIARLFPGPGGYLANLKYDFSGTHEFDEPWWYYPVNLLSRGLPWTPAAIVGLVITARQAWIARDPIMRFLWCWAIVPIIVLSIPHRKHHHYLVPSLAPWAILAAIGLSAIATEMFKGPMWSRRPKFGLLSVALPVALIIAILAWCRVLSPLRAMPAQLKSAAILVALLIGAVWLFYYGLQTSSRRWMLIAVLVGIGGAYSWSQTHLRDATVPDTQFLRNDVEATVPKDKLLAINGGIGPLDFFRVQFYLRPDALLLHNLTYLRSDKIHTDDVYVVTDVKDEDALKSLGDVELIARSSRPPRANVPELALFHLTFSPGLHRYPPPKVSPMQAMMRQPGPWCGPPITVAIAPPAAGDE
jgi:4-amino-4-deoxy-L-arabinose transferase-like glycosyltransferase